jgi:hypothetical protein
MDSPDFLPAPGRQPTGDNSLNALAEIGSSVRREAHKLHLLYTANRSGKTQANGKVFRVRCLSEASKSARPLSKISETP